MSNINTATRRRQWVIAGVAAAVMLATGGGIWAYSHHQAELNRPAPKAAPNLTGSLVNTSFTEGVATSALQQQQNKTAGLERDLGMLTGTLKSQNEELQKKLNTMADAISQLQTQQAGRPANGPAATSPAAGTTPVNAPVSTGQSGPAQWSINNPGSGPAAGQGGKFYPSQGQAFYPGAGTVRPGGLSRDTFTYAALTEKKTKLPWIPSGSFSEAVMIEGADANASVTGQQNTSPVVITLLGDVSMPNGKTWNMDQCRVTGEMYGDISSERGEVRTKNISCILKNGKHIDMPFDGHVSFQGKVGIRGKPVMRNGAIVANAGAAGLLSGFGEGIQSAATPTVGLGGSASVGAGDIFKQGLGGGASKAADTLSQYWIKRAEQYHPVIDIGAGNAVTVVFQQGFRLETIEDAEAEKAKQEAPQAAVQQASAVIPAVSSSNGNAPVLNPDEVLRQASQLRLGDTIN
ncbi:MULTISPECIES: F-type conjugal transfer pilus assembly protein TraB [unclassified Pantoea]|uniref:F-type conjugal transfer pilus assembly protein TraB n=1 Tax=unclassified Pantoea TaxID=2630326 RepID=UPI0024774DB8|nr:MULTISPECIES: F-type conjugal transfer pilus assembly protein TraB [unclassified Pantoea]GME47669.1 F-type conjugal transfer pilus assembly protein TraB [Pantoea sp. QMID3]GME47719.1 F-type conjugal transfer pilus assembly protein TraB [Pantoea sp. QMID1]GME62583.1 F-type conjugal transfer pilus assembly protein TraB [Pantoea sp. QMID4]GME63813.1 F-type conjugal transfer pilus assembly protein TraB [Pantoea sp. QMID2]